MKSTPFKLSAPTFSWRSPDGSFKAEFSRVDLTSGDVQMPGQEPHAGVLIVASADNRDARAFGVKDLADELGSHLQTHPAGASAYWSGEGQPGASTRLLNELTSRPVFADPSSESPAAARVGRGDKEHFS